jgi:Flp pilus assembly pilin Flp
MLVRLWCKAQTMLMDVGSRLENEDGVIATEYIIMLVLVALAIIAGASYLGVQINTKLSATGNAVRDCVPAAC